ncbi:ATP-binding protein [Oenococcus phage phi9805]|uniref:Transporter n=1 Tax=Oenococcus phage phi9805 TaxID=1435411 RepID=V9QJ85_9CAUD|nr:ATP-binding protein [Oenococcus oeni]YP_009005170.1 ATP-binding protein [Oenococcus phage phi9805]AHC30324.1 transporter [Oenococcus phage phi9805]KGH60304.1 hypothetical protein X288_02350 [Oenococcus oeni IOEB_9805]KGH75551.1 hypothetical protein X287_04425 [Oenococcus oeni IOEB_9803]KGH78837.1 hypothetical protein X284_01920 [Oenococcus oeni IOEB_8417]
MFTNIALKNYKSFHDINVDLTVKNDINHMVAIYGENGAGKSNFIETIFKLQASTRTIENAHRFADFQNRISKSQDGGSTKNLLNMFRRVNTMALNVKSIFSDAHMISSTENMVLNYKFIVNNKKGEYILIFSPEGNLIKEQLSSVIEKRMGLFYSIESQGKNIDFKLSPSLVSDSGLATEIKKSIPRLWGTHTFLAIFDDICNRLNRKYVIESSSENFRSILNAFGHISFKNDNAMGILSDGSMLRELASGKIPERHQDEIAKTEAALNKFFPRLYTDIKAVKYETKLGNGKIDYRLFAMKKINGNILKIPFDQESSGTKNLLDIFPLLLAAMEGGTVVIDEIDTGIHDLLITNLIENIEDSIKGQLIFTTHDTVLMQQIKPDSVYIIQVDFNGKKRIVNLPKSTDARIRESNNVQKLYLSGYFSGIPYVDDVDFEDIIDSLQK